METLSPESSGKNARKSASSSSRNPSSTSRHNDEIILHHFRRLRGPEDTLRGHDRQPLRDYLVMVHASLVEHCARPFLSSGEPLEDLLQEGSIGLIKAVDRFDPDKGVRFSTYACHLIAGEMRHYLRDLGKMIHEPGWHAELRGQIMRASDDLIQKLGRAPQPEEIASALDMQPQVVRRVLDSSQVLSVASLDVETDEESGAPKTYSYDETDTSVGAISTSVENRLTLDDALPQLRDLEKRAVTLFYYGEHSKTEIARQMGISVNYAAYLVKRGVEHLRRIIEIEAPVLAAPPAPPIPLAWSEMGRWIEENAQRDGAPTEFALLFCRISNWNAATSRLSRTERAQAEQGAAHVMRRSCRKADLVVAVEAAPFEGLHFLALMPNTGASGERAGERWLRACNATAIAIAVKTANAEVNASANLEAANEAATKAAFLAGGDLLLGELEIEYSFIFSQGGQARPSGFPCDTDDVLRAKMDEALARRLNDSENTSDKNSANNEVANQNATDGNAASNGFSLAADGLENAPHLF